MKLNEILTERAYSKEREYALALLSHDLGDTVEKKRGERNNDTIHIKGASINKLLNHLRLKGWKIEMGKTPHVAKDNILFRVEGRNIVTFTYVERIT